MLLAAFAFLLQGVGTVTAHSAAVVGFMPQPAQVAAGTVHFHGPVAHAAHTHEGHGAGHVHNRADPRNHDIDGDDPIWTLSCVCADVPQPAIWAIAFVVAGKFERLPQLHLAGIEPEGLSRPPSTPDIA